MPDLPDPVQTAREAIAKYFESCGCHKRAEEARVGWRDNPGLDAVAIASARATQEAMLRAGGEPAYWVVDGGPYDAQIFSDRETAEAWAVTNGGRTFPVFAVPPAKGEVKVKPLEWDVIANGYIHIAANIYTIEYDVKHWPSEFGLVYILNILGRRAVKYGRNGRFDTIYEAKAAAQADYEQRIRAALVGEEG